MKHLYISKPNRSIQSGLTSLIVCLIIGGCSLTPTDKVASYAEFEACTAEAWSVDKQAHDIDGEPKFLLSARIFAECDRHFSASESHYSDTSRMVPVAMASLNFARGGDIQAAAQQLAYFEASFPEKDLYFADGSSFVDTMRLITANHEVKSSHIRMINVNDDVRAEFLRLSKANKGGI